MSETVFLYAEPGGSCIGNLHVSVTPKCLDSEPITLVSMIYPATGFSIRTGLSFTAVAAERIGTALLDAVTEVRRLEEALREAALTPLATSATTTAGGQHDR